jgi:hypothetical protein
MSAATAASSEQAFFIEVGTHRLFALLHRPAQSRPSLAVVMCHALAEEKLWSHRAM